MPLDVNIFRVTPFLECNRSDKPAIKPVLTDSPPVPSTSASTSLSRLFKTLPQMLTSQPHRLSSTHTTPLPTLRLRRPSFLPFRTAFSTSIASAASPISDPAARMAASADMDRFVAAANTSADAPADMDGFVAAANTAADAAGEVIRKYFRKSFDILDKDDLSPVTIADQDAEEAMMSTILESFPSHAIFGEENGWRCKEESADYVWVLDPIDGTKSFITGKPLFGTLIALLHKGKPIVGIIDQPILRERWIGMSGRRTTMNGREVSTRDCSGLSQAYLYTTSPHLFTGEAEAAFSRIRNKVKVPLYGCDCYAYALLASGFVDLVVESGLKPYDFLSLVPVIEGAGGLITDWSGHKLHWEASPDVHVTSFNVAAAGDPQLHKLALNALEWQ